MFYLCETDDTYLSDGDVGAAVLGPVLQSWWGKIPFKFTVKTGQPF